MRLSDFAQHYFEPVWRRLPVIEVMQAVLEQSVRACGIQSGGCCIILHGQKDFTSLKLSPLQDLSITKHMHLS